VTGSSPGLVFIRSFRIVVGEVHCVPVVVIYPLISPGWSSGINPFGHPVVSEGEDETNRAELPHVQLYRGKELERGDVGIVSVQKEKLAPFRPGSRHEVIRRDRA